jgi:hypothetical protein
MSAAIGPNLVEDGLAFHVDAINSKCYPGSGTLLTDLVTPATMTLGAANVYSNGNLVFDGTGLTAAQCVSSATHSITGSQTLGAVFQGFSNAKPHSTIICTDTTYQYGAKLMFYKNIERVTLWLGMGTSNLEVIDPVNLVDGVTRHLMVTWDMATGAVNFYINGVFHLLVGTVAMSPLVLAGAKVVLGREYHGMTPGSEYTANMKLYSASVYNRALTAAEVAQNFNALRGRYGL